jgi:hypothetical protein
MLLSSLLSILAVLLLMTTMMMPLSLLLLSSLILTAFLLFWHQYCVGDPVVAFTSAVDCVPAVVSGHDIAVILAVLLFIWIIILFTF